ncbi:hypothetical protein Tco_1488350 [Tanacetum coccineum]
MYHNLNQLQWQLERKNLHSRDPKTCLDVPRTQLKEFLDSKEVNALDFQNKCWLKNFKDYTRCKHETYRCNLLQVLDVLDKLIDERVHKYRELRMKEREVQVIKEIEKQLKEREIQHQESLVMEVTTLEANLRNNGTTLDASLVTEGIALDAGLVSKQSIVDSSTSSEQQNKCNSSRNECNSSRNECNRLGSENKSFDNESNSSGNHADDIGPSYDSDTVSEVHSHMFENVFAHGIQNHEQLESIPDTYVVNENNSNINYDTLNMDPDGGKEEHDDVNYEQLCALFASLINNLKCDVEKSCQNDKTFAKENGKFAEYVQSLLKRKNELEKTNQEFLKQINDLDNKLRKTGQTAQTLHTLLPKEDSVNTGKQGLGFENLNDVENPFVLNKAKELAPSLYDIDEMGKELLSDHKIISRIITLYMV